VAEGQRFGTPLRKPDSSANHMNPNAAELKYADIRISCPILPKNGQSFVNKNPNQPTAKRTFLLKLQTAMRSFDSTIFDHIFDFLAVAKNPTRDELQQVVTP
jgi:hypothetical protein